MTAADDPMTSRAERILDSRLRSIKTSHTAIGPAVAPNNLARTWATRYRRRLFVTDTAVIVVAVVASFVTRFGWSSSSSGSQAQYAYLWIMPAAIAATWLIGLQAFHTRDARVVGLGLAEYRAVVNATILIFGLLAIVFVVFEIPVVRGFFVLALPLGLGGIVLDRWLWRNWLVRQRQRGKFVSRAIVVGEQRDVEYVIKQIDKKAVSVYQVVGAALDLECGSSIEVNSRSVAIVSDLANVAQTAAKLQVDTVIVAGQPRGGEYFIRNLGWDLEGTVAELVVASRLTNIAGPRIHLRPVEGLPLMHVELPHYAGGKHLLKRAFDITCSAVALVLLMPVMVVIGLVVHRDSPGPVLFRQERVGKDGRRFFMLKFRSMVATAEDDLAGLLDKNEGAGVLFKMKNDPRITKAGQFLRKHSLDELPQLWNILAGDMSVVGPRPPLQSEVESYEDRVHRRLFIKPGLTGMWQVNGRSNLDWDESVRLDLFYVENWSLTGDFVIIWRTIKMLLNPVGAY